MKKSQYILGAIVTSLVAGTMITNLPTFAATASSEVSTAPSIAEITSALDSIKSLPGYSTYASMSNADREQATPLFREYRYLAELVKTGEAMVNDYANQTPEDLAMILQAAQDGYKGCSLIFANANSSTNQPAARAVSNPTENTTSSTTTTVSQAETTEFTDESSSASAEPAIVATSETTPTSEPTSDQDVSAQDTNANSLPLTLAHTTTTFTAFGAIAASQKYLRNNRTRR